MGETTGAEPSSIFKLVASGVRGRSPRLLAISVRPRRSLEADRSSNISDHVGMGYILWHAMLATPGRIAWSGRLGRRHSDFLAVFERSSVGGCA